MASLHLNNVSDYIEPSMACVNPAFMDGKDKNDKEKLEKTAVSLAFDDEEIEATPEEPPKKATIALSDCLACTGCVTSTESVLVNNQSRDALVSALGSSKSITFMVSAASMVELERYFEDIVGTSLGRGTIEGIMEGRLRAWCREKGGVCQGVFTSDSEWARRKWLADSYNEFADESQFSEGRSQRVRPVLTSHCPGFVCYAEKSAHPLVDSLSRVKSCMMLTADLLRGAGRTFVVAVEPCHDKKLEATRSEFKEVRQARSKVSELRSLPNIILYDALHPLLVASLRSSSNPFLN